MLQDEVAGKTLLQDEVAGKTNCRFRPNLGERKFKIKLETCRKVLVKVDSVPVLAICKKEFLEIYAKGYD